MIKIILSLLLFATPVFAASEEAEDAHIAGASQVHGILGPPTSTVVGTEGFQVLKDKEHEDPIIGNFQFATHDHSDTASGGPVSYLSLSETVPHFVGVTLDPIASEGPLDDSTIISGNQGGPLHLTFWNAMTFAGPFFGANSDGTYINFVRGQGGFDDLGTAASALVVNSSIGILQFLGADSDGDLLRMGRITSFVDSDGTVSATDVPGGFLFQTWSDTGTALMDVMAMRQDGHILHVNSSAATATPLAWHYIDSGDATVPSLMVRPEVGQAATVNVLEVQDSAGTDQFAVAPDGDVSGAAFLDEDNMASDDAEAMASQQSIKAYADTKLANVVEDTTPQLGGDLDGEQNDIADVSQLALGSTANTSADADLDMEHANAACGAESGITEIKDMAGASGNSELVHRVYKVSCETTDATIRQFWAVPKKTTTAQGGTMHIDARVMGHREDGTNTDTIVWHAEGAFRMLETGAFVDWWIEHTPEVVHLNTTSGGSGYVVDMRGNLSSVVVEVTGAAGNTVNWNGIIDVMYQVGP